MSLLSPHAPQVRCLRIIWMLVACNVNITTFVDQRGMKD